MYSHFARLCGYKFPGYDGTKHNIVQLVTNEFRTELFWKN